ncbi:MAG: RraA family protein [Alphaproteobacteria bacterium]|jgi:regulator of RNase E activity RraA|nr:RraA family protein [Alphaproteobacteria bacterium]
MDLAERLEKLYASAVYDVMREMGHDDCVLPPTIRPLRRGDNLAGEVQTINGHYEKGMDVDRTLLGWATVLSQAPAGKVLICQPNNDEIALMGELSAEALTLKGVRGYIADGGCRDVDFLLRRDFPVFARFYTPKDIGGRWLVESMGEPIQIGGVAVRAGDYVLADTDGIVILPADIAEEVVAKTEAVASTENEMRDAILAGVDPVEAYKKYGMF